MKTEKQIKQHKDSVEKLLFDTEFKRGYLAALEYVIDLQEMNKWTKSLKRQSID